ncbi:thermosome subunit [Candidatus Woesearchaeota archaeon CG10_big_fil_rev_8_21_14_0_10_34_8]|nr:MAG: thermosome subunit [Candidatus Woesearchaeota archaeon CG10_big_fil_rev_8_21_14_0_10_34_8]
MDRQQIVILPENVQRMMGKDAQRNNIMAAKAVADTVKTTLGPKGMDKMLVDGTGNIIVTNDGVTILEEMDIEHPAAKMMVEIAKTQDREVGDGTTTAVMLAGKLLENAEKLLDQKIHPTVISKGYRIAAEKAQVFLNEISKPVSEKEVDLLKKIAMTSMIGKGAESSKEKLADIIVQAVRQITEENGKIDLTNIKLDKKQGQGIESTQLIGGIVLAKEKVSADMPNEVRNARIALLDCALEIKGPEGDTKINITSPDQLQGFIDQEDKILKDMVEKLKASSANVIFSQKGIDDIAQYYLAKSGIYACRRIAKSDMEKLARATGGKIVSNLKELTESELGKAALVEEVKEADETYTYISGCSNPKAITILIHGGTSHIVDEAERAIKDGLGAVSSAIKEKKIVAGAGAVEIELAKRIREFAQSLSGREQLAVEEFASALEFIPSTLAENAGLDPIDILTELKSRHDKGEIDAGINTFTNKIENVFVSGVIEPLKIKTQAISSASEVANMILRIDDVIAAGNKQQHRGMPPGMPEYE